MTLPDEQTIAIRGTPLSKGAVPKCCMCGTTKGLGRIISPGFRYGPVFCPDDAVVWMDVLIKSFTEGSIGLSEVIGDIGLL